MEERIEKATLPQIFFNNQHIGGYNELLDLEGNGQLDSFIESVKNNPAPEDSPNPPPVQAEADGSGMDLKSRTKLEQLLVQMGNEGVLGSHRKLLTVHHNSITGKDLLTWLSKKQGITYENALVIGGDMVTEGFLVHASDPGHPFADSSELFSVVGAGHPSALNSGLSQTVAEASAVEIGENLRKVMTSLSGKHISEDGMRVDYEAIKNDVEFAKYVITAQSLQRVRVDRLTKTEKIAMFINVYNALVVHGIVSRGAPTNQINRYLFFKNVSYVVGGQLYSLNEIENGILRGNRKGLADICKPFSGKDPRLAIALEEPEPRVHFALNCGSKGCPPIRFYSPDKLDNQLTRATKSFLTSGGCTIDKHKVSLSPILKWYKADFGSSDGELLKWVVGYISHTDEGRVLQELIDTRQYDIVWQSYDWSLNH